MVVGTLPFSPGAWCRVEPFGKKPRLMYWSPRRGPSFRPAGEHR
jgi:hypothetical protein